MNTTIDEILKQALKLPPEARAAIAGSLLDSLDETLDPEAETMWEDEVLRRLREIEEGKVEVVPWAEARRRVTGW